MPVKTGFAAIIGIGAVLVTACNQPVKQSAFPAEIKVIQNQGARISYTDIGVGDTVLFFVHGWCINKTYWTSQLNYFKDRYRIIAMDLPGFGESGKNRNVWTTEMFGSDIDSVMTELNLKNVILIGHSMAGDIILQAAVLSPGRVIGLVGVDNFKGFGMVSSPQDKEEESKAIDLLSRHFKETAFQYFNESLFSASTADSIKKRVLNDVANSDSVIAVACMRPSYFDEIKTLSDSKLKLYLINSDVNPTDTSGFVKYHIPFEVFYVHGTGHFPMVEDPAAFNRQLDKAIAGVGISR